MLKRLLLFLFFTSLAFISGAQDEEPRYQLNGKVFAADSSSALSSAYVIIKRMEGGSITDSKGRFTLYVKKSDTLLISYTGFATQHVPVSNLKAAADGEMYAEFYMRPLIVQFRAAVVTAIKNKESEKSDREFYEGLIKRYVVRPSLNAAPGGGLALQGGLSALIMPFTHRGKEMIKFEQMYQKMETERVVNRRFNEDLVHDLTGLDYEEIPAFKRFCGFSPEFVLASNDYDFYFAIRRAYDRYMFTRYGQDMKK